MARLLRLLLALAALLLLPTTTTTSAAPFAYDAPATARVEFHDFGAAEVSPTKSNDALEGSASPSVEARRTSTTPAAASVATNNVSRLPQDLSVSPTAPEPLPLNRPVGSSPTQNQFVQNRIGGLQGESASDFRVNQQQVDINGTRVGANRPDLQYTLDGQRYYEEFDTLVSTRGPGHAARISANDPSGIVNLFRVN